MFNPRSNGRAWVTGPQSWPSRTLRPTSRIESLPAPRPGSATHHTILHYTATRSHCAACPFRSLSASLSLSLSLPPSLSLPLNPLSRQEIKRQPKRHASGTYSLVVLVILPERLPDGLVVFLLEHLVSQPVLHRLQTPAHRKSGTVTVLLTGQKRLINSYLANETPTPKPLNLEPSAHLVLAVGLIEHADVLSDLVIVRLVEALFQLGGHGVGVRRVRGLRRH